MAENAGPFLRSSTTRRAASSSSALRRALRAVSALAAVGKSPAAALELARAVLGLVLLTLFELLLLVALEQLEKLPLLLRLGPWRGDSVPDWSASSSGQPLRARRCCCITEARAERGDRSAERGDT